MNLFSKKNIWKTTLSIVALIVVISSVLYTNYIVNSVSKEEAQKVKNYVDALETIKINESRLSKLLKKYPNIHFEPYMEMESNIIINNDIPLIWVNARGDILSGHNFGEHKDEDKKFLQKELNKIQADGVEPLEIQINGIKNYFYYQESQLIRILRYYPMVMFGLVATFITIGFLGFRSEKNAEQSRVWAGLAKETAHQLGTPISGIIAWIEHLKMMKGEDEETMEIVTEIERDTQRLEYIANRFSKIGSDPELSNHDLTLIVHNIFKYMEKRAPRRVLFEYPPLDDQTRIVRINPPLFEWVLENLLRNALDSIGRKGLITGEFIEDADYYYIDISDTGKGIPDSKFKTVFKPGYTTKKRGWGLGLSLAKRIVESYHNGKIFVKESVVGEGTVFRIQIPKRTKAHKLFKNK